jgi:hypothetical protein
MYYCTGGKKKISVACIKGRKNRAMGVREKE